MMDWKRIFLLLLTFSVTLIQDGEAKEAETEAEGKIPPGIVLQPPHQIYFFPGQQNVKLPIMAKGSKPLTFVWKKNNSEDFDPNTPDGRISMDNNTGTVTFSIMSPNDQNIYQCFISNHYGTAVTVQIRLTWAYIWNPPLQKGMPKEKVQTLYRPVNGSLILDGFPPVGVPPLIVTWFLIGDYGNLIPLPQDGRIIMDKNNRLYITRVQKSDEHGGLRYACFGQNKVSSWILQGYYSYRVVVLDFSWTGPPSPLWFEPREVTKLRGELFSTQGIFAGNPPPELEWSKNGEVIAYGAVLDFGILEFEHAGTIRCTARNNLSSTFMEFTLIVRSKPWYDERNAGLKDLFLSTGQTATYSCKATADPIVIIMWLFNGKGMEEEDSKYQKMSDRVKFTYNDDGQPYMMTIKDVKPCDTMTVQCVMSNQYEYLIATAILSVSDK